MTTYLRNWLFAGGVPAAPEPPTIETTSPQPSDDEDDGGSATETEQDKEDDDIAPAFPAINSAQRATSSKILTDSELMPPPPMPGLAVRTPGVPTSSSRASSSSLFPPPKPGSSTLALPPSTTKAPPKPSKKREKVALAPGHSPLDWANLKASGADLRVRSRYPLAHSTFRLKQHNKKDDAWSAFYGKVYNITPYIPFHPGGEKELMRVAGRDGTKLFATTHGWVSAEMMLDSCLVGFLVSEPS
ncbi:cytoplasmic protein [Coprinopsis sp. MPI-PUGE-AT-0042]|nr:cytoplasmic protein [Coprinopsis sp. MPI-PUGE-AT-0042]